MQRLNPDPQFVRELQGVGGDALTKCYQCATCSVACPISPSSQPYPRKEMIWAQWGLKDKLMSDIDVWMCHNCGTCSDLCPRGARPGDLLAAIRNMTYRSLTGPAVLGKWMSSPKYLPMLAAIPAIIYLIIWIARAAALGTAFPLEDGNVVFGALFPGDYFIDPIFGLLAIFVFFTFVSGVSTLIKRFKPEGEVVYVGGKKPSVIRCLWDTIVGEIVTHKKFADCGEEKAPRKIGHLAIFYAFIALAIVTSVVAIGHWMPVFLSWVGIEIHGIHTPMPQTYPVKLLANFGAILGLVGLVLLTMNRLAKDPKKTENSYYDWYLLGVIWVIFLTGIGSELLRLANFKYLAYPTYFVHLVAVFMLIGYLPWSKLGHLVYRTAALTYARYLGRKVM